MSTNKSNKTTVWVIGYNNFGELGVNHRNAVRQLQLSNISKHSPHSVHSGRCYSIYATNQHFSVIGINTRGQCGLDDKKCFVKPKEQKYFSKNNIKISKVCVSSRGYNTFWITDKGQLYGNGWNKDFALGLNHKNNTMVPQCIPNLMNVIDAQPIGDSNSIALLFSTPNSDIIIMYWCRRNNTVIPIDIINEITIFYHLKYTVYSTGTSKFGNDGQCGNNPTQWTPIPTFKNVHISKICSGYYQSLFLESNGILWSCGTNTYGQLGRIERNTAKMEAKRIEYFISLGIKIKDIACGDGHNLVIDYENKIYSFGGNKHGSCGDGTTENVVIPKLIVKLKEYEIIGMDCGAAHSYAKTKCGKHFLWGDNSCSECLTFDGTKIVLQPFCINNVRKEFGNGTLIKQVSLAYDNTKIILHNMVTTWLCIHCGLRNNMQRTECQACFVKR